MIYSPLADMDAYFYSERHAPLHKSCPRIHASQTSMDAYCLSETYDSDQYLGMRAGELSYPLVVCVIFSTALPLLLPMGILSLWICEVTGPQSDASV